MPSLMGLITSGWNLLQLKRSINMNDFIIVLLLLHFCDCTQDKIEISSKTNIGSHSYEKFDKELMSKKNAKDDNGYYVRVLRSPEPILNNKNNNKNNRNISPNNVHITHKYNAKGNNAENYFEYIIKAKDNCKSCEQQNDYTNRSSYRHAKILKPLSVINDDNTMTEQHIIIDETSGGSIINKTTTTTMATPNSNSNSNLNSSSLMKSSNIKMNLAKDNTILTTISTGTMSSSHTPRQNSSPDIQDIITGIVKLLNGNVNVHANTQGMRRPTTTRINNRGPPRITDDQTMPLEYDNPKPLNTITSMRPSLYPFERPDRPFITGVPIPEQIVPYRPNFVSNRPPWHRNKPRPPISTNSVGGRRPIPQYKPLPTSQMIPTQEDNEPLGVMHTDRNENNNNNSNNNNVMYTYANIKPNETYGSSEASETIETFETVETSEHFDTNSTFSNPKLNDSNVEHSNIESNEQHGLNIELSEDYQTSSIVAPFKKEDAAVKKKPNKYKTNDKKKHTGTPVEYPITPDDVHSPSKYITMSMDLINSTNNNNNNNNQSMEEVIFVAASKTPSLTNYSNMDSLIITNATIETPSRRNLTTKLHDIDELKLHLNPTLITTKSILSTSTNITNYSSSIIATSVNDISATATATATATTTTATITTRSEILLESNNISVTSTITTPMLPPEYQPRPGIVLDDPEFKPGGSMRPKPQHPQTYINPTRKHLPPGYGEIFDVTLSAIQGPGSKGGSQHTINIKPYTSYNNDGRPDIITSPALGEEEFVSIDGTRAYINLFGDSIDSPSIDAHQKPIRDVIDAHTIKPDNNKTINFNMNNGTIAINKYSIKSETSYVVVTDTIDAHNTHSQNTKDSHFITTTNAAGTTSRNQYRPRTTQPPVRIDTCIVGDDTTCDQTQQEYCKTENGVSSCHCRPGYSRRKHREPCRRVITFCIGMRVDRIYEHRIVWDNKLKDRHSEPYSQLSYESIRALDSAMSMTPYSDEFMEAKVNNIYHIDESTILGSGVFVNLTIKLDESAETLRPNLRSDVQKHLLGVLHRRNNNIGNSVLFVNTPEAAVTPLRDLDECQSRDLNDCHQNAMCSNIWGSFRCTCQPGTRDHYADQPHRAGRTCLSCPDSYCNNRGECNYNREGVQLCECESGHYGSQCEIDSEVLAVAVSASVAAVIIIVLTLVCLVLWSRRWQREQKNAIGSPIFGYMSAAPLKSPALLQSGYQVTLEDRMRWAQVADVMSPTNYYGTEPIGPTRPSSALFAYPNLQVMGVSTLSGMPMQAGNTMQQLHQNSTLVTPPIPMPRLELSTRNNAIRTMDNSSSSEEEDRTDLLGRNFQVPRPKSRSNGSITNQSGIYYDVDYELSGNGIGSTSVDRLYGSQNHSSTHSHANGNQIPGPQGIPMSTYTSGRAPSSYYIK